MHSILVQSLAAAPAQDTAKQTKRSAEGEAAEVSFDTVFDETTDMTAAPEPAETLQNTGDPEFVAGEDPDTVLHTTEETPEDPTKDTFIAETDNRKNRLQDAAEQQSVRPDTPGPKTQSVESPSAIALDPAQQKALPSQTMAVGRPSPETTGTIAKHEHGFAAIAVQSAQKPAPNAALVDQAMHEKTAPRAEVEPINSHPTNLRRTDQDIGTIPQSLPVQAAKDGLLSPEQKQAQLLGVEKAAARLDQNAAQVHQSALPGNPSAAQHGGLPEQAAHAVLAPALPRERRHRFDAILPQHQAPKSPAVPEFRTTAFGQNSIAQAVVNVPLTDAAKTNPALEVEPLSVLRSETSSTTTTQSAQTLPTRTELPQHVARQIAEALQTMPNRPVEIRLNPEELGRVRLGVSTVEGNIMVTVLAERPETSDLMRRHISALETAFQELGYSDISFAFGGGDSMQPDQERDSDQGSTGTQRTMNETVKKPIEVHLNAAPVSGLDIRL